MGLLVALVAVALIGIVAATGGNLRTLFAQTANRLGGEEAAAVETPPAEPETPPPQLAPDVTLPSALTLVRGVAFEQAFTVTDADGTVISVGATASPSSILPMSGIVIAGTAPAMTLTLTADAVGTADLALTATDNDGLASTVHVAITVEPPPPSALAFSAATLTLGGIDDGSASGPCNSIALTDNGGGTESVGTSLSGDGGHFIACTPAGTECGGALAAGESCTIGLQLAAGATGTYTAQLTATAADGGAAVVQLSASASGYAPTYLPTGVALDVPASTLTSGGWTLCERDENSAAAIGLPQIVAGCSGSQIVMACSVDGGNTLRMLARANKSFFQAPTVVASAPATVTTQMNGAYWYFFVSQASSFGAVGFKPTSNVSLSHCDTTADRNSGACWHLGAGSVPVGGFNCGATNNGGTTAEGGFTRMIYSAP